MAATAVKTTTGAEFPLTTSTSNGNGHHKPAESAVAPSQTKQRKRASKKQTIGPDYTPTPADAEIAKQLIKLYHDRRTPALFKHAIFEIFPRVAAYYDLKFPNSNWTQTKKWLPSMTRLVARARVQGHMVTSVHFTFEPTPEREAELDAEEKIENDARAVFDLIHDPRFAGSSDMESLKDSVVEILDLAHPYHTWETFRVAWPLGLAKAAGETDDADDEQAAPEISERAELVRDAEAIARILNSPRTPKAIYARSQRP